ncbi:unnamed protein product [Hyaloperonospora brassicae]|uniref:Vps16 C-terminal domain-containing protein n=1 Tax=Hyaloperonospora brassicae TaxID=162125 RepID=A0AAV0V211_HYABA|nr:unnamed protein product [Hyaloperonospora brassicae]
MDSQTFEMWLAHADLYSSKHTDFDDSKTLKVLLENPISIGKVVKLLVDVAEDGEKALSTKAARLHIALAESQGLAQDVMQLAWLETRHDPTTIFKILSKGDKDFLTKRPKSAIEWLKYNELVNEWSRQQGGIKRSLSKEEIADLLFRGRSFDESMVFIQKFLSAEDPKLMALAHQLREILSNSVSNAHKAKKLKAKKR